MRACSIRAVPVEPSPGTTMSLAFAPGTEGGMEPGRSHILDGRLGPAHAGGTGKTQAAIYRRRSAFSVSVATRRRVSIDRGRTPTRHRAHKLAATVLADVDRLPPERGKLLSGERTVGGARMALAARPPDPHERFHSLFGLAGARQLARLVEGDVERHVVVDDRARPRRLLVVLGAAARSVRTIERGACGRQIVLEERPCRVHDSVLERLPIDVNRR